MNKRQKAQLIIGILSAILFIVWIVLPGNIITRLLGMLSSAMIMLSMYLSYRAEEKKKKQVRSMRKLFALTPPMVQSSFCGVYENRTLEIVCFFRDFS